jgi:hypothetical protein
VFDAVDVVIVAGTDSEELVETGAVTIFVTTSVQGASAVDRMAPMSSPSSSPSPPAPGSGSDSTVETISSVTVVPGAVQVTVTSELTTC